MPDVVINSSSKVNSFGSYLETVQARHHVSSGPVADMESKLLEFLSTDKSSDMAGIVNATGLPLADLLRILRDLKEFGLIRVVGEPGDERFEPTPSGTRTVRALR